jgi:hypothetical protein
MSKSNSSSGGIGFTGLLTVAFIVLKLCKVINWSWWWVLSPLWIAAAIVIILGGLYFFAKISEEDEPIRYRPVTKSKWQERLEEIEKQRNN